MPLNTTDEEQLDQAVSDLDEKMRLERRMIIELRELFREMAEELQISAEINGFAPSATLYTDDFLGILSRHSRRVSAAFVGRVLDFLEAQFEEEGGKPIEEVEDDTTAFLMVLAGRLATTVPELINGLRVSTRSAIQTFNKQQSITDTAIITATNQRQMDASIATAMEDIEEQTGIAPTKAAVGAAAASLFIKKAFNRANTIATTFTQKIAESTKNTERQAFFELRNGFEAIAQGLPTVEEIEIWQTMEDQFVRQNGFNHVAANKQRKKDGFFTVSGELLTRPGDPSASFGNIVGCRCGAIVVIE